VCQLAIHDLERLRRLEIFVDDADFRALWHEIKQDNKRTWQLSSRNDWG